MDISFTPRTLELTLGYRGTRFSGWARQPAGSGGDRRTVQAAVEAALTAVLGHPVSIVAAGRTDAGVHAEGQVVSFDTVGSIPPGGLRRALNVLLPEDVWVVSAGEAPRGFHARRSALRRWYRYAVWQGEEPPTEWRGRVLISPDALDLPAMRRACRHLLGRHDMAALVGGWTRDRRPGRSTWRTVFAADWLEPGGENHGLVLFEVGADAFLRQMVRTMVGSLLWVGRGKWTEDDFAAALRMADRRSGGPAAPAEGLTLWRIEYDA
ncbi:MAG: tRNA pseudouridine(38-40) synthase TruA [Chloroflexi bacterium]|nr:tRNA pseudouridine(38-40) synthase TruA [Chloroflexota bacterium]